MISQNEFDKIIEEISTLGNDAGLVELEKVLEIASQVSVSVNPKSPSILSKFKSIFRKNSNNQNVKTLLEQISSEEQEKSVSRLIIQQNRQLRFSAILEPLEGKDQDVIDHFILRDNSFGIIICDGISGEGTESGKYATLFSSTLKNNFLKTYKSNHKVDYFQNYIETTINKVQKQINLPQGGTTLIVVFFPSHSNHLYLSWMGDGHAILFNKELTGFSKLIHPSRDRYKRLTSAITADGIFGRPLSQIHFFDEGTIILSTDGFDMSNGKVLNHFYHSVINNSDAQALSEWQSGSCCENQENHGKKHDDRTLAIIKVGRVENLG